MRELILLKKKIEMMREERSQPHPHPQQLPRARQAGELNMLDWVLREIESIEKEKKDGKQSNYNHYS